MKRRIVVLVSVAALMAAVSRTTFADSPGDSLAKWIDQRGQQVWGEPPPRCDDQTFARRLYLDLLGRVPSVSELRDFQHLGDDRRRVLVDQLVFANGPRADDYRRLSARNLARHWRRILIPPGTTVTGPIEPLEVWLGEAFAERMPYDEIMRQLARTPTAGAAGNYYQLLGSLPENYAGHMSRIMLGVRIECAQCHDHPFASWSQEDLWGLAAFYSDLGRVGDNPQASTATAEKGTIEYEGTVYRAKLLWSDTPLARTSDPIRGRLARWIASEANPNFAATAVNRVWQYLVGRGLYADVENLDQASDAERAFLDDLGRRFAEDGFDLHRLIAAICESRWYQAVSVETESPVDGFARPLKVVSPEQLFDSLEQALLLPVSRLDPTSPRWSGDRSQLVNRLSETVGTTPEDYASGIPQALLLMNGKMTGDAINLDRSRLLRAVVESPFLDDAQRIRTLYLAVLTRDPSAEEAEAFAAYLDAQPSDAAQRRAYGEILWALLNSPEFALCR